MLDKSKTRQTYKKIEDLIRGSTNQEIIHWMHHEILIDSSEVYLFRMIVSTFVFSFIFINFVYFIFDLQNIVLICYYHYYNKRTKCERVSQLLDILEFRNCLNIFNFHYFMIYIFFLISKKISSEKERVVFSVLANGPSRFDDNNSDNLLYFFSSQARDRQEDCSIGKINIIIFYLFLFFIYINILIFIYLFIIAHFMVNVMAITLGTPPNCNFMYSSIFNFADPAQKYSPGSTAQDKKREDSNVCCLSLFFHIL